MKEFLTYAPIIIVVIAFALNYKIFVTPAQLKEELEKREKACEADCQKHYVTKFEMQLERKNLMDDVRREFLEIVAFEQFGQDFAKGYLYKNLNDTVVFTGWTKIGG
jgi:hypothetical protein